MAARRLTESAALPGAMHPAIFDGGQAARMPVVIRHGRPRAQRVAAVALRSFATSAGCTAGAPLFQPARMNVSTSAIWPSSNWFDNAGIGYADVTPPIT